MFNVIQEINWIAVILSSLVFSMLGGVWFAVIFGKAYNFALGKEKAPKEKPSLIFIVGPFICGVVTIIAMDILIYAFNIQSIVEAITFGGIVGIGLLGSTTVNTGINPNIPRPFFYGLISGSYFILASLIISVILVVMK